MVAESTAHMVERGVAPWKIKEAEGLNKVAFLEDAVEKLIATEEAKREYLRRARIVSRLYKAILPAPSSSDFSADVVLISVLAERIRSLMPIPKIRAVMRDVEDLLDRSVAPIPYETPENSVLKDISKIDFESLRKRFEEGKKRTEVERLRALLSQKLSEMVARNPTRAEFLERFKRLMERYNSGTLNVEVMFSELSDLYNEMAAEEQEAVRERLSEEEKAFFDILTTPEPELTGKEREQVKAVARSLLKTLKNEKLVLDWTKKEQARGAVRQAIEVSLDHGLPDAYDETLFYRKCDTLYRHVFDAYLSGRDGIYATG